MTLLVCWTSLRDKCVLNDFWNKSIPDRLYRDSKMEVHSTVYVYLQ